MTNNKFAKHLLTCISLGIIVSAILIGCQKDAQIQTTDTHSNISYTLEDLPEGLEAERFYTKNEKGVYQELTDAELRPKSSVKRVPYFDDCWGLPSCSSLDVNTELSSAQQYADSHCTCIYFFICCCQEDEDGSSFFSCRRYMVCPRKFCISNTELQLIKERE